MIKLDARGLVPAIVQDADSGKVLMLGYASPGSIRRTLEDGQVWFYSRSRQELWHKGDTSGNYLNLQEIVADCDGDALLFKVRPEGPACHTGSESCFFIALDEQEYETTEAGPGILEELFAVIQDRKLSRPEGSYTVKLLDSGPERIAQKVIEEAGETALAGATGDLDGLPKEVADMLYHTLALLASLDVSPQEVWRELRSRRG